MPTRALIVAALVTSACTTFHLPQVFLRGSYRPAGRLAEGGAPSAVGESFSFQAGLAGHLGDVSLPAPPEDPEPTPAPTLLSGEAATCRVALACAWERRALAEARARVIGGAP